ncbi:MAG: ShlB/FhaC/HecB family hemolysin secretion/activation protein [Betaproteobacteria bacterium]|nr:ShlB/FhaC/HecB family hemolysin secretion/activation protein [Betaproteobacteria bacterium]
MVLRKSSLALSLAVFLAANAWAQSEPQSDTQPPQAQESERFDIERFSIEGNTLLSTGEIEELIGHLTGKEREYGDVQRALELLENRYRERGYSAVQVHVPEQELGKGVVVIGVIEASIRRVRVQGNEIYSEESIRRAMPAVREGAFPNAVAFSQNVQLANENPSRQVNVVMKGTDQEGLVDLDINVDESDPLKFTLSLDNTGNKQTGQHRLGVGMQYANLWGLDHVLSLNYGTSVEKQDQVSIFSISYRVPLYALGDSIDVIVAKSDVNAGTSPTVAGPLNFAGKGDIYGLRYNLLLPRSGEFSHRVVFGLDMKAIQNNCTIAGAALCGSAGQDVTSRPVLVTYSGQWARPGEQSDFSLNYTQNIAGAGMGKSKQFALARPSPSGGSGASANFSLVKATASHFQSLPEDWQMRIAGSAQYSRQSLISGEQFGIAGSSSVRGFSEREVARDTGYYANFELFTPNLGPAIGYKDASVRLLHFYDLGYAVNNTLQGEDKQKSAIASVGMGIRFAVQKNFNWRFDFARVVDQGGAKVRGARKAAFAVSYGF